MDCTVSEIRLTDRRGQAAVDALLSSSGLRRDARLDYVCGVYDEAYSLKATGSCSGNTLRCLACAPENRGEGLMNLVISHLTEVQFARGNTHFFLYTKPESADFFRSLGFYLVAETAFVSFMENRKNGFQTYLESLKRSDAPRDKTACVIMNANPFTLGHRYLLERAAEEAETVHVFVLSEDAGPIPARDRLRLVREGAADLEKILVHETGPYQISNATFPEYFLKEPSMAGELHAELDLAVFQKIAERLKIGIRFCGEEPFSPVTDLYNHVIGRELPGAGIRFRLVPRLESAYGIISASRVREAVRAGDERLLKAMVPESTFTYLTAKEQAEIRARISASEK